MRDESLSKVILAHDLNFSLNTVDNNVCRFAALAPHVQVDLRQMEWVDTNVDNVYEQRCTDGCLRKMVHCMTDVHLRCGYIATVRRDHDVALRLYERALTYLETKPRGSLW